MELPDARTLVAKGVSIVLEGANMPTTNDAIEFLHANGVILAAAKAANAGGVAVSGLEMAQNAGMVQWDSQTVDTRLKVRHILYHTPCAAIPHSVSLMQGSLYIDAFSYCLLRSVNVRRASCGASTSHQLLLQKSTV